MITLHWDDAFEKKLSKYIKKHPELHDIIYQKLLIFVNNPYSPELKNHKLSGKLKELNAIKIDYDCRLIFKFLNDNEVLLVDIGSHDEVY